MTFHVCPAERLQPIATASVDLIWLANVLHYFRESKAAIQSELHRILKPGGHVLVQNRLYGAGGAISIEEFFPSARGVITRECPPIDEMNSWFAVGYESVFLDLVAQETYASVTDAYEAANNKKSDLVYQVMDDGERVKGIELMKQWIDEGSSYRPFVDEIHFAGWTKIA